MRIDVHAHYWIEDYLDLLAGLGRGDTGVARGLGAGEGAELDARLQLMDRAGVQLPLASTAFSLETPSKTTMRNVYHRVRNPVPSSMARPGLTF
jgi:hypothetical protein